MHAWTKLAVTDEDGESIVGSTAHEEAARLLKLAAKENIPQAFHYLGILYEYGLGVPRDFEKAMESYTRAAESQYIESIYHLALMYAFGRGGPIDYRRAIALLEGAGRADHAPSSYYMGVFKMNGYGCQPSYEEAVNWFEKAAALDDYRVSARASKAAHELTQMLADAHEYNEQLLASMQQRSDRD